MKSGVIRLLCWVLATVVLCPSGSRSPCVNIEIFHLCPCVTRRSEKQRQRRGGQSDAMSTCGSQLGAEADISNDSPLGPEEGGDGRTLGHKSNYGFHLYGQHRLFSVIQSNRICSYYHPQQSGSLLRPNRLNQTSGQAKEDKRSPARAGSSSCRPRAEYRHISGIKCWTQKRCSSKKLENFISNFSLRPQPSFRAPSAATWSPAVLPSNVVFVGQGGPPHLAHLPARPCHSLSDSYKVTAVLSPVLNSAPVTQLSADNGCPSHRPDPPLCAPAATSTLPPLAAREIEKLIGKTLLDCPPLDVSIQQRTGVD